MRRSSVVLSFVLLACASACSHILDVTSPDAHPVRGIELSIVIPGSCLLTCAPVLADHQALAIVRVVNRGGQASYVQTCGTQAMLVEQQYVLGQWVNSGAAIICPVTPRQLSLAPGDSIRVNWYFASGRSRIVLGVGGRADLSDAALAAAAAIDVP
ncbi:MAG: hypothetical protein HYR75_09310 [Gemmatimonadetes bacterium]|nr:hypothetical protein [Gemmatimonadota bacterium]MBI3568357.1 hypothetical protein [Gemmatimonadota bacterium]